MRKKALLAAGWLCAVVGVTLVAAPPANAAPLPVIWNFPIGFVPNLLNYGSPPPGAIGVDWRSNAPAEKCTSSQHPTPVLLLHGTWANQNNTWQAMSPYLKNNNYCVYTTNYGGDANAFMQGTYAIPESAKQIAIAVDKILAATGASKVSIVGHSQGGGPAPRYYMKFNGGASKVDKLIGLGASNHGTTLSGLVDIGNVLGITQELAIIAPAARDQNIGSDVNKALDAGGDTVPGVAYTVIINKGDQFITPWRNAFLTAGPGATVENIELSEKCFLNWDEHLALMFDQTVGQLVLNALDPATAKPAPCVLTLPYVGG